jgi:hypothetical protein
MESILNARPNEICFSFGNEKQSRRWRSKQLVPFGKGFCDAFAYLNEANIDEHLVMRVKYHEISMATS